MSDDQLLDRLRIQELIQKWIVWRDTAQFERFRTIWHDDGQMVASWTQSGVDEFIEATRKGMEQGINIIHFFHGNSVDVNGNRGTAETKVSVSQRATIDGVLCDVTSEARHYDFWERRAEKWGLVLRIGIYDKDRLDPVVPGTTIQLDEKLLARFPESYKYLSYMMTKVGYTIKLDLPCGNGPEVKALYQRGTKWLEGNMAQP
jgi:hypothetical protein